MENVIQLVAPMMIFVASLFGGADAHSTIVEVPRSVELGLREMSPQGEEGGFAIPASGCGVIHNGLPEHECSGSAPDITVNTPIIRLGDPVTVSWDPKANVGCVLSTTVTRLTSSPNPSTAPNASAAGSRIDEPTGETIYTISCTGTGNTDTATAKVLPRIQET